MRPPNCLVVAERFPNIYESYILNQIEFLLRNGAKLNVLSGPPLGQRFDERIDKYGLDVLNFRYAFDTLPDAFSAIRPFLGSTHQQCRPYQGLKKLLGSRHFWQGSPKSMVKALVKSPILGSATNFDLVHAHRIGLAYENIFLSEVLRVPLVVSFHGLQTTDLFRPFFLSEKATTRTFAKMRLITAGSEYAKRVLVHCGCPVEKIRIVPVGINLNEFPFHPTTYSTARKIVLLTVARLSAEKGHEYAITAVKMLRMKGWNVEYRIVGGGPLSAHLQAFADNHGASDYVTFTGERENEDLRAEYRNADIFLLPSVYEANNELKGETQGLVIQEAQASGKLVVATRIGGIPECVDSHNSVLLVRERSSEALATGLERLLENGEEWYARQHAGRAWVERRFSMDVLGQLLVQVYEEAMQ
jgi:colanic acid/amylovoran biosynthesis glycosyltransferase